MTTIIQTSLTADELVTRLFDRNAKFTPERTEIGALLNRKYHDENVSEGKIERLLVTLEQQKRMVASVLTDDGYERFQQANMGAEEYY